MGARETVVSSAWMSERRFQGSRVKEEAAKSDDLVKVVFPMRLAVGGNESAVIQVKMVDCQT